MTDAGDQDVWAMYARGVKKLGVKSDEEIAQPQTAKPKPAKAEPPLFEQALKAEAAPQKTPEHPAVLTVARDQPASAPAQPKNSPWKKEPLDLRIERNMSLGDIVIEAKIDLHGRTEQEAYDSFKTFVEEQQKRGKRMLLVITGKGPEGGSVIRQNLPRWCNTAPFDTSVLAVRTAAQHHGGEGAYYVLLGKRR